jgi:hypothetical protein
MTIRADGRAGKTGSRVWQRLCRLPIDTRSSWKVLKTRARRRRFYSPDHVPGAYDRIYFAHVRKTGGTSVISSVLTTLAGDNGRKLYEELAKADLGWRVVGERVIVGFDHRLVNEGLYYLGFSHVPLWALRLRARTCHVTVLRDPVERIVSHYRMLRFYQIADLGKNVLRVEGQWLASSFDGFLSRVPKEHLLNQLFMFSEDFCVQEAVDIISSLELVLRTETLSSSLPRLAAVLGLKLEPRYERSHALELELEQADLDHARELLRPEYEMMSALTT